jgi:hypothetical protein
MGEMKNHKKFYSETLKGRYHLRYLPRNRWEDNIKLDLKEIRHEGLDWIS